MSEHAPDRGQQAINGERPEEQIRTNASTHSELTQEEMRRRYIEQQRRRFCPGCGEAPIF